MTAAITVTGLSKSFGALRAVDDVSFSVEPGKVTAFLGPNGAGKTTTLRMILGLVSPTSGTALIGRTPYPRLPNPITQVGAVLETAAFHPGLSARAHLDVLRTAARLAPSRVAEVLEQADLTGAADQRVGRFSLGMRQRLAIACALLGDPGTLVLDEPANGLDPQGIHWLREFLRAHAREGRAVLVSTHVLAEIERIADHALILSAGRLVRRADLTPGAAGLEDVYLEATRCSR